MLPELSVDILKGTKVTQEDWVAVEGLQYQTLSMLVSLLNSKLKLMLKKFWIIILRLVDPDPTHFYSNPPNAELHV